ncbi:hypothetical protein [Vibrio fluvialis]|uniref:hypothetical protein n=2 Tax=Vibrio fluvialis TaxID=676 RepID=UPI001EEA2434|nr:hypothetical protein [Vibrio fluvialis]MCG6387547.1 hypothetical protein [Vibrio fluvialis]
MLMHEKKRKRALKKGCLRQASYRHRQRSKQLDQLQLRITRKSHKKAVELRKKTGWLMGEIYLKAIEAADLNNLPAMHQPSFTEEDIGVRSICPWATAEIFAKFDKISNNYRSTVNAMSAILYNYCCKALNE